MELAHCIAKLSSVFHSPSTILPGQESQFSMSPMGRYLLIKSYQKAYRPSAVMILLFPDEYGHASTLFIERTKGYGPHGGQIALPGGAYEPKDKHLVQTAIRETQEEIGVSVTVNKVLGKLTPLPVPVSGFEITPVIAFTEERPKLILDKIEVDNVIEASIQELKTIKIRETFFNTHTGIKVKAPYYPLGKHKLWGATAMIIAEFLDLL